jgi:hypothetical protein
LHFVDTSFLPDLTQAMNGQLCGCSVRVLPS